MIAARLILALDALAFLAFGVGFLAFTAPLMEHVEINTFSATARADIRAQYGGFQVGLGLFLLVCVARRETTPVGLLAAALCLIGFAVARTASILLDGPVQPVLYGLLAAETTGAVVSAVAWLAVRGTECPPAPSQEDW